MLYIVVCNFGTRKYTWTKRAAMSWLPYCGPVAAVGNAITGKVIAHRTYP